ncbi:MAG: hypothetical protein ABIK89_27140 [Planctomycetota bacterium]
MDGFPVGPSAAGEWDGSDALPRTASVFSVGAPKSIFRNRAMVVLFAPTSWTRVTYDSVKTLIVS